MPELQISCGPYDVFASGTVLSHGMNDLSIHLAQSFKVAIHIEPQEGLEGSMEWDLPAPETLLLTVKVPHAMGFGLAEPSEIGQIGGRVLHALLRFDVFGTPVTSYRVDYTFYLGERA